MFDWTAKNVKALPSESQLPPEWTYNSGVSYFVGDVNDYYRELEKTLLESRAEQILRPAAGTAIDPSATNRLDALKIIRDFVAKNIRLAGPGFTELPLSELSAADTTLADGYGHLADRAILLHAMLSAAGFQPEFVLASDLPAIAPITKVVKKFPLPQDFQYPLVRVVVDGQAYYLNDTDEYAELGTTAHADRLALALAGRKLETVEPAKDCGEKSETLYSLKLTDNGQAQIGVTRRYFGSTYNEKKRYFSELPPEERRRYFQEAVSDVAQGARPVGDLVTKFDSYPGVEEFRVTVDHYAVVDGTYFYFDLPFTPSLFPVGADSRVLPLFIAQGSQSRISTEITLPADFHRLVIAPADKKLRATGGGAARVTTSMSAGKFSITHELQTTPAIIAPADYSSLLRAESALSEKSARALLLQKK